LFWWSWFSLHVFTFVSICLVLFVDGFIYNGYISHNTLFKVTQITQVWHILQMKKDKLFVWLAWWTWTFKHPIKNLIECNEINQLHPSHTYWKYLYTKKW
jgi:hypothetical protein